MSISEHGSLPDAPSNIDSDTNRPCRISERFEIIREGRPVLFPTILGLLSGGDLTEEAVYEQVWWHIHLGAPILDSLAADCRSPEELLERALEKAPLESFENFIEETPREPGQLLLTVGQDRKDKDLHWALNDTRNVENPHAAIIGVSGQGKTQFALDLLVQIAEQDPEVSFTILDYKGDLSQPGTSNATALTNHLKCQVISAGVERLPVVPFQAREGMDPEQAALLKGELLAKVYPRLGTQQRLRLREALKQLLYEDISGTRNGFGFEALDERIGQIYDEADVKPDGLIEITSKLRLLRPFLESKLDEAPLLGKHLVLRLSELASDTLPVAFLLLDRLYEEMRVLPDASHTGSITGLRHVIFIDEAHHFLPFKTTPLTSIIREGRSKGVSVLLATQSVTDLASASGADYREFLSTVFFFKTNVTSANQVRAMIPARGRIATEFADKLAELSVGEMLFTRHLPAAGSRVGDAVIQAVQFYRR